MSSEHARLAGPIASKAPVDLGALVALEESILEATDVRTLKHVHDKLEAVQRFASRMRLALGEQNRIAILRIRAARKLGGILATSVRRGGNSHGGSSAPLPEGISWNQSSRWQKLARVSEPFLAAYVERATAEEEEVTVMGFLKASSASDLATHFSSEREEWLTPKHILDAALAVMGGIDLDPCAEDGRGVPASDHFTENEDGLSREWEGRVYMNPPYGKTIDAWVAKLSESFEQSSVSQAVALLPSRTDTGWFRRLRSYPRSFLTGRLTFSGHGNAAPFPSVVVYLGKDKERFAEVFSPLGDCYVLWSA